MKNQKNQSGRSNGHSYLDRILIYGQEMKNGEVRQLDKTSANYQRFVDTVKQIMDMRLDIYSSFQFEFNADYSKLRRIPFYQKQDFNADL